MCVTVSQLSQYLTVKPTSNKTDMNKSKLFLVCALVAPIELIAVPSGMAQELFHAFFTATCISTTRPGNWSIRTSTIKA